MNFTLIVSDLFSRNGLQIYEQVDQAYQFGYIIPNWEEYVAY